MDADAYDPMMMANDQQRFAKLISDFVDSCGFERRRLKLHAFLLHDNG
jgi:hypothetical protein